MNKYTFKDNNGETWERVTKPTAKKHFIAGEEVLFIPCNLRPFTPWHNEYIEDPKQVEARNKRNGEKYDPAKDFEMLVNAITFYSCINTETGKYPAFYIRQEANA